MSDIKKVINKEQAKQSAQKAEEFWSSIDGEKLAKVGLKDKEMDSIGRKKSNS